MSSQLQHETAKFKSKEFAKASMAICAMISAADGSIDASERQKTAALIMANPTLQMFDATALRADFDHYCNALTADFDFGKIEAVQALSKLKSKPDQARAVIQIGIIIGGAGSTRPSSTWADPDAANAPARTGAAGAFARRRTACDAGPGTVAGMPVTAAQLRHTLLSGLPTSAVSASRRRRRR